MAEDFSWALRPSRVNNILLRTLPRLACRFSLRLASLKSQSCQTENRQSCTSRFLKFGLFGGEITHPRSYEQGRAVPIIHPTCVAWTEERCPSPTPCQSTPERGGESGPRVVRAGEQCLLLSSCSTQESSTCTL